MTIPRKYRSGLAWLVLLLAVSLASHRFERSARFPPVAEAFDLSHSKTSLFDTIAIRSPKHCIIPQLSLRSLEIRLPQRGRKASTTGLEAAEPQEMSASSSPPEDGGGDDDVTYVIRDCQYRELSSIASLVVESFYDKKKVNLVARKLYQLAEMNRLQQNFPYPESRSVHRMLVVEAQKSTATTAGDDDDPVIVGFCDVDARPCATKLKLPRPYLSDLAIDPRHRRRGLARRLVEASEDFVRGNGDNSGGGIGSILGGSPKEQQKPPFDELWIRVASDNLVALGLYREKLGYSLADWSTGEEPNANKKSNEPEVWTLRKDLRE